MAANKWAIDKYTKYHYNRDGTIKVTDTVKHFDTIYKPYAVCDMKMSGGHIERTIYDADGKMLKQINPTDHGKPKAHPYGNNGEHAHDVIWNGNKIKRTTREINDIERKEHADIL